MLFPLVHETCSTCADNWQGYSSIHTGLVTNRLGRVLAESPATVFFLLFIEIKSGITDQLNSLFSPEFFTSNSDGNPRSVQVSFFPCMTALNELLKQM